MFLYSHRSWSAHKHPVKIYNNSINRTIITRVVINSNGCFISQPYFILQWNTCKRIDQSIQSQEKNVFISRAISCVCPYKEITYYCWPMRQLDSFNIHTCDNAPRTAVCDWWSCVDLNALQLFSSCDGVRVFKPPRGCLFISPGASGMFMKQRNRPLLPSSGTLGAIWRLRRPTSLDIWLPPDRVQFCPWVTVKPAFFFNWFLHDHYGSNGGPAPSGQTMSHRQEGNHAEITESADIIAAADVCKPRREGVLWIEDLHQWGPGGC